MEGFWGNMRPNLGSGEKPQLPIDFCSYCKEIFFLEFYMLFSKKIAVVVVCILQDAQRWTNGLKVEVSGVGWDLPGSLTGIQMDLVCGWHH